MSQSNDLAKNTIMLSIGTFMTKGLSFIMIPFFSRWLSTADYGTFDLLCTYVAVLIPIIGISSNEAIFRLSVDKDVSEKRKFISSGLSIFATNYMLVVVICCVLYQVIGWRMAPCFCLLLGGELFNTYLRGYLRSIKKLNVHSFVNAITTVFIAIYVTILVRGINLGLSGIVLGYGFGYICGDIIVIIWTRYWKYFRLREIKFSTIKKMVSYSYALIPNSIAWWIINVSDRTIINIFLGAAANGIYAIAYKVPNLCSSIFQGFSISWQQTATEVLNEKNRDRYYNDIYNKMIKVLISICCGILSLNSWLFNIIFDNKYYEAHLYVPLLICAVMFMSISQFYGSLQISFCEPKENGMTTVLGAIVNLAVDLCLIQFIGLYAAVISTLVSQLTVCIVRLIRLRKKVVLKTKFETKLLFIVFAAFFVSSFYIKSTIFNVISVVVAIAFFIACNWNFILKMFAQIKKGH